MSGRPSSPPSLAPDPLPGIARLSFNQITAERASLRDVIDGCARHGISWLAIWRHKLADVGVDAAARLARDAGIRISSVCRGGMFPALTAAERGARIDDNRRAIDEAATLGAEVLILVCGAAPDRDIAGARAMVEDAIAQIAPYAAQRRVRLGIEPLHPAFAAERSCITTLREARELAERIASPAVGVVADVYHIWWDPALYEEIARVAPLLVGFHVSDWLVPATNVLMNRGMMGDGVIELRRIRAAVESAGYRGPIEVEIFNEVVWDSPLAHLLELTKERYLAHV